MYKQIQKTLDWGVKFASLAITAPATWVVATELFSDIESAFMLFVMRFAAVFLIEGVLLSNWLLLEFDTKATPEIKARYAITALTMYVALAVIGFRHEGPTGIVFRVALLAALIGSGWDTYVMTWQRATRNVDRSAQNARKVKRHARKLSIKEAITRRESDHYAELALIDAEGTAKLEQHQLYGKRLIAEVRVEDKGEMKRIIEQDERLGQLASGSQSSENGKKKLTQPPSQSSVAAAQLPAAPTAPAPVAPVSDQKESGTIEFEEPQEEKESETGDHQLIQGILDAFEEEPRLTQQQLADKLGSSRSTIGKLVREMRDDGTLVKEGRAHYPSYVFDEMMEKEARRKRK